MAALGATLNRMAAELQRQLAELEAARHRERAAGERALAELRRLHSEFVAIASHELRTPVAAAKSYAELLLREGTELSPETRRQALVRLDAVCERLARLVRALLGASRIQAGRLEVQCEPVDVAALARRVLADVAASTAGHQILLRAPEGSPALILADADRVEDILVNLIANAGKYAPEGTPIRVEVATVSSASSASAASAGEHREHRSAVEHHEHRGRALAAAARPPPRPAGPGISGTLVEVRVIDQGPGIPEDEQAAVFERFRRGQGAERRGGGPGPVHRPGLRGGHGR